MRFDCVPTSWKRTALWRESPSTGAMPAGLAQEADQIIALQPGAPDGYLLRAVAEIDRKQYSTADEYIHRSLEKEPNNPAAYVQLGNLRMAQNQYAEAQKAYQQALDQDPNSTDALGGMLNVDLAQKQPDRGHRHGSRPNCQGIPRTPGFTSCWAQLLLEQRKDLAGAEQEFKQASDLDKKNSEALVKLGVVQNERGATDQALQTYLDGSKSQSQGDRFLPAGRRHLREQTGLGPRQAAVPEGA